MHISATELNNRPGAMLNAAIKEPVIVEKSGKPSVVMVSYERYQELEDFFWGESALRAEKDSEWLTTEETEMFLNEI